MRKGCELAWPSKKFLEPRSESSFGTLSKWPRVHRGWRFDGAMVLPSPVGVLRAVGVVVAFRDGVWMEVDLKNFESK